MVNSRCCLIKWSCFGPFEKLCTKLEVGDETTSAWTTMYRDKNKVTVEIVTC